MKNKLMMIFSLMLIFSASAEENMLESESQKSLIEAQVSETTINEKPVEPLMIIRFNKPVIEYQKELNGLLSKIGSKKNDLIFDIVGFYPENTDKQKSLQNHLGYIENILTSNKIDSTKINRLEIPADNINYNEIHITVK